MDEYKKCYCIRLIQNINYHNSVNRKYIQTFIGTDTEIPELRFIIFTVGIQTLLMQQNNFCIFVSLKFATWEYKLVHDSILHLFVHFPVSIGEKFLEVQYKILIKEQNYIYRRNDQTPLRGTLTESVLLDELCVGSGIALSLINITSVLNIPPLML